MSQCEKVDPPNKSEYSNTSSEIDFAQAIRLMNFIHRHNLWDKFIKEDAAGQR